MIHDDVAVRQVTSFSFQTKENHSLLSKSLQIDTLLEQLEASKDQESIINRLKERITELESEVAEVRHVLADSQAEAKIALESMEKERLDKDEVQFYSYLIINCILKSQ